MPPMIKNDMENWVPERLQKKEPSFSEVGLTEMPAFDKDTPMQEQKLLEASCILASWVRITTYWLSRREVAEMLNEQAEQLLKGNTT